MPSFEEEAFARAQQMSHSRPNGNRASRSERRADERTGGRNSPPENSGGPQAPSIPPAQPKPDAVDNKPPVKPAKPNVLETLFEDRDKSLIIMLLLLLMDEDNDPSLLLALVYLLM